MSLTATDKQDIKVMINNGIKDTSTRVTKLEVLARDTNIRLRSVEISLEDTGSDVKKMLGMLSDNLKVQPRLDDHEARITDIETIQPIIVSTVALHSKQLNA